MIEKINDARYRLISQPSSHALDLARRVLDGNQAPLFCEVGIGIGATSIELYWRDAQGELRPIPFDFEVHAYRADPSLRCFHVNLTGLTGCDSTLWGVL